MHVLNNKPVIVVSSDGEPVSMGKFVIARPNVPGADNFLELLFETETLACRLRVPPAKFDAIKASWDGTAYHYVLPAGNKVWQRG